MAGLVPDSFALDGGGNVVLQQASVPSQGPQTRVTGADVVRTPQAAQAPVAPQSNWGAIASADMQTLDTLNKLAGGILQPIIEQQEKRQYYEGMAQVAQGKALVDIEKEHPWYTQLFGPSATVRGAQAMTAMTTLTQAHSQFLEQMPTLRTKSPGEVQQFLVNQASSLGNTGDPVVDTLVQAKLAENWGSMLETHMKQHIAWQQEDMLHKQVNLNLSNAADLAQLRSANASTGWSPEAQQRAYDNVITAAAPAPGQPQDSWSKGMVATLRGALQKGQFDFYNAIRGSKLWEQIDPAARNNLEAAVPSFVQRNALTNPAITDITSNVGSLHFALQHGVSGYGTLDELHAGISRINAENSARTGSTEPLITNAQQAIMDRQFLAGNLSLAKAQAALKAKEQNYIQSGLLVGQAFNTGRWDILKGQPVNAQAAAQWTNMAFDQAATSNDPQVMQNYFAKAAQASGEEKLRSPKLTNILNTQLTPLVNGAGPVTPQQQQALSYAQLMYQTPNGPVALANYLGSEAPKVIAMLHSGADLSDPKQLMAVREAIAKGWAATPTKQEKSAAAAVVSNADPGFFSRYFPVIGGPGELSAFNLSPEFKQNLANQLAPEVAMYNKAYNLPLAEAATLALNNTMRSSDLVPGAIVPHNPAFPIEQSLSARVNQLTLGKGQQTTKPYQDALRSMITDELTARVKATGMNTTNFDPSDWEVRSGEQIGGGKLMLMLWNKNPTKATAGPVRIMISAGKDVNDPNGLAYRVEQAALKDVQIQHGTPVEQDLTYPGGFVFSN